MSKVDDFERMTDECKRLEKDLTAICSLKGDQVELPEEVKSGFKGYDTKELLTEGIRRPEFRKMLTEILELRVQKARNEAIEECQKFLQKHVVAEVMES